MLDNETRKLFKELINLQKRKLELMKAEIEYIINKKITDDKKIQLTLDYLFDLLDSEEGLLLYRKLCKYYYNINPQATIRYVNYYKEQYDLEG